MQISFTNKASTRSLLTGSRLAYQHAALTSQTALISTPQRSFVFRRASQRSLKKNKQKQFHNQERTPGVTFPHDSFNFNQEQQVPYEPLVAEPLNPLRFDSTFTLVKKFWIYKMMGSNLFINYSLLGMRLSYKLLGVKFTNLAVEKTCGSIFTGGVTLADLLEQQTILEKQSIGTIGMSVVEGLRQVSEEQLDKFMSFTMQSINKMTEGRIEGHLAVKLTAFISTEVMEKLSTAQRTFIEKILCTPYDPASQDILSRDQLRQNLAALGIDSYSSAEFDQLCSLVSDEAGNMTAIHRYAGGHLFQLYGERSALQEQIARVCGQMTDADFEKLDLFYGRVHQIAELAQAKNCSLYVDAEQTFIQPGIESFGQQMTHKLNHGDQVIIMNGYQCYAKRMAKVIPMEVAASKLLGYHLGVKLIRGAYMNEERNLAAEKGYESPIWDDIESTHKCYNDCMEHVIENMKPEDMVFVASHNVDTVEIAKNLATKRGFKDLERVRFGQLRGFSDQVTGQLAGEGFTVYKYLPFGPTEEVMPYLVRRGQESRQVLREQKFQNETLKKEIFSRMSPF